MDSCQIFNFIFGTRKTTTQLRKCFSSTLNEVVNRGRQGRNPKEATKKSNVIASCDAYGGGCSTSSTTTNSINCNEQQQKPILESETISPIKQIQVKLTQFTGRGSKSIVSDGREKQQQLAREHDLKQQSHSDETCGPDCGTYLAMLVDPIDYCESDIDQNHTPRDNKQDNIYHSDISSLAEDTAPIDEHAATKGSQLIINSSNHTDCQNSIKQVQQNLTNDNSNPIQQNESKKKIFNKQNKNERVRNLIQSFELNADASLPSLDELQLQSPNNDSHSPIKKSFTSSYGNEDKDFNNNNISNNRQPPNATAIVKPLPPKTPPKSLKAKCLNFQLNLNKPMKLNQLIQDEDFLSHLFKYLEPLDRCSAAQVCRKWRNVLYSDQSYWKDLVNVINCTQLRREHLVDCIMNTLHQSARLKQYQMKQTSTVSSSNNKASIINMNEIDQDELWRIKELWNRFTSTRNISGHNQASSFPTARSLINSSDQQQYTTLASITDHTNTQDNSQYQATPTTANSHLVNSKSSSIPSQISSTLSSVSISSLLSPLSESSRLEVIREKLYVSLNDRGFDSICLFGATDEDIDDLTGKTPTGARHRISVGRLNNCSLTDQGLQQFLLTFNQIEELELSGCNEITNVIDLRPLKQLSRLTLTDCINIADGFAQRLVQIFHQLDEFVIQAYHLTDAFLEFVCLNSDTSRLKHLGLLNCKDLTNQSMLTIAKHFQSVEQLSISGSTKISDDGIEILAEQANRLVCLDLSWCTKITDAILECLACDQTNNLIELILDRNVHITDIGLGYLSTMSNLSLVYIRWCSRVTDIGLESLLKLKSLKYLSLAGLHQITARSLLCLIELADSLIEVELTNCPAVNGDLLQFLKSKMPKCKIIF